MILGSIAEVQGCDTDVLFLPGGRPTVGCI
jgi:hypothetical protein